MYRMRMNPLIVDERQKHNSGGKGPPKFAKLALATKEHVKGTRVKILKTFHGGEQSLTEEPPNSALVVKASDRSCFPFLVLFRFLKEIEYEGDVRRKRMEEKKTKEKKGERKGERNAV